MLTNADCQDIAFSDNSTLHLVLQIPSQKMNAFDKVVSYLDSYHLILSEERLRAASFTDGRNAASDPCEETSLDRHGETDESTVINGLLGQQLAESHGNFIGVCPSDGSLCNTMEDRELLGAETPNRNSLAGGVDDSATHAVLGGNVRRDGENGDADQGQTERTDRNTSGASSEGLAGILVEIAQKSASGKPNVIEASDAVVDNVPAGALWEKTEGSFSIGNRSVGTKMLKDIPAGDTFVHLRSIVHGNNEGAETLVLAVNNKPCHYDTDLLQANDGH